MVFGAVFTRFNSNISTDFSKNGGGGRVNIISPHMSKKFLFRFPTAKNFLHARNTIKSELTKRQ